MHDGFLAVSACLRLTHLGLSHSIGVPPAAQDVPSAVVPCLAILDSSHGLAAALARSLAAYASPVRSTAACIPRHCLELGLVLAPDVECARAGSYCARWEIRA
ncbi:hypothetical protein EDB83DRAFT_2388786, partial [Lactarius deliciosus]